MIFKLINANKIDIDFSEENDSLNENSQMLHDLKVFINEYGHELKIGYVVPMTSIRKTLKTVFKETQNGLKASMVIAPFDIFKADYDVLFVDEAHRLAQYKNIGFLGPFAKNAGKLGKDPSEVTQLDMIMARSKYRILVYDQNQTVKGSDITQQQFEKAFVNSSVSSFRLTTQMRCIGGELYTEYLDKLFACTIAVKEEIANYDFKIFADVNDMVEAIKKLDSKIGLCRNAAGYAWEWISKGMKNYEEIIKAGKEDIRIGNYKYVWNMTNQEFILSENAVNEIGCIHTLQGYDLNYVGVILGYEIDYNPQTKQIEVDLSKFYDTNVKKDTSFLTVKKFIINSYKVIMSRGIKGCYVYACNPNMQKYLEQFIDLYNR